MAKDLKIINSPTFSPNQVNYKVTPYTPILPDDYYNPDRREVTILVAGVILLVVSIVQIVFRKVPCLKNLRGRSEDWHLNGNRDDHDDIIRPSYPQVSRAQLLAPNNSLISGNGLYRVVLD